jgi:hypothetical protein
LGFASELSAFREPDLMPPGRQIIECCLAGGTLEDDEKLIPHGTVGDERIRLNPRRHGGACESHFTVAFPILGCI